MRPWPVCRLNYQRAAHVLPPSVPAAEKLGQRLTQHAGAIPSMHRTGAAIAYDGVRLVRDHEPAGALEAGEDGLDVIRALLVAAEPATTPGSQLLMAVGVGQAEKVMELGARTARWEALATYLDLNRIERVVHLRRI